MWTKTTRSIRENYPQLVDCQQLLDSYTNTPEFKGILSKFKELLQAFDDYAQIKNTRNANLKSELPYRAENSVRSYNAFLIAVINWKDDTWLREEEDQAFFDKLKDTGVLDGSVLRNLIEIPVPQATKDLTKSATAEPREYLLFSGLRSTQAALALSRWKNNLLFSIPRVPPQATPVFSVALALAFIGVTDRLPVSSNTNRQNSLAVNTASSISNDTSMDDSVSLAIKEAKERASAKLAEEKAAKAALEEARQEAKAAKAELLYTKAELEKERADQAAKEKFQKLAQAEAVNAQRAKFIEAAQKAPAQKAPAQKAPSAGSSTVKNGRTSNTPTDCFTTSAAETLAKKWVNETNPRNGLTPEQIRTVQNGASALRREAINEILGRGSQRELIAFCQEL